MVTSEVLLGIVGLGNMGKAHAAMVQSGKVAGMRLTAVCVREGGKSLASNGVRQFTDFAEMVRSGLVNAVLIATPHYSHTSLGVMVLEAGLHVLVEKPLAVSTADAARLVAAHRDAGQVFGAMFQMRADPLYQKVRRMIERDRKSVV